MFHLRVSLKSLKVVLILLSFFFILPNLFCINAQVTPILYGGAGNEYAYSVIQTMDGGYATVNITS